jgi:hypothetical protein
VAVASSWRAKLIAWMRRRAKEELQGGRALPDAIRRQMRRLGLRFQHRLQCPRASSVLERSSVVGGAAELAAPLEDLAEAG